MKGNVSDSTESVVDQSEAELSGDELVRAMRKKADDRVHAVIFAHGFLHLSVMSVLFRLIVFIIDVIIDSPTQPIITDAISATIVLH